MDLQALQYPIGKWTPKEQHTWEEIQESIAQLKTIPAQYKELTAGLSEEDLLKQYREGSWTVRQVIHHVADIHVLYFVRFKHALTEINSEGVVSKVDAWANLEEAKNAPIDYSLTLLKGTHLRWTYLLEQMTEEDFQKGYYHPTRKMYLTLMDAVDVGVWHSKHHLAHIKIALGKAIDL